jgi:hypothetical protein
MKINMETYEISNAKKAKDLAFWVCFSTNKLSGFPFVI